MQDDPQGARTSSKEGIGGKTKRYRDIGVKRASDAEDRRGAYDSLVWKAFGGLEKSNGCIADSEVR